ncbi:MAG: glycosyltransferase family 4 protein [Synergistetes bacterium]|nr:glycosyltransferase family 4 protein [Synergistota bacterium]
MKVLFCIRKDWRTAPGGDVIQMLGTKEAMEKQFDIKIYVEGNPFMVANYNNVSIVHVFNIQNIDVTLSFIESAKAIGKKVILSPIFWNLSHACFVNTLALIGIFDLSPKFYFCERLHRNFAQVFSEIGTRFYYFSAAYKYKVRKALNLVDMLLPNSIEEKRIIEHTFDMKVKKCRIVLNAVDKRVFNHKSHRQSCENSKKEVICVARIEPVKNQISIIRALEDLKDIKVILVGRPKEEDRYYYESLLWIARERGNVEIIENHLDHQALSELYRKANVHVLPSFRESPGLSTLEALCCGLNVVISDREFLPVDTYFKDLLDKHVFMCNPYDPSSIRKAVLMALESPPPKDLISDYIADWEMTARETYKAYLEVLEEAFEGC